MQINIYAVGKNNDHNLIDIQKEYIKRLPWKIKIHEIDNKNWQKKVDQSFIENLSSNASLYILDENGKNLSSQEFAQSINHQQIHGLSNFNFLIGGAEGFSNDIKKLPINKISFGRATWPHLMVRTMLIEQIYRAYTIIQGIKYHK